MTRENVCLYLITYLSLSLTHTHTYMHKYTHTHTHTPSLFFSILTDTDWGPEQDEKTLVALADLLDYEAPQLAVLTGDQLTGLNIDANATTVWDSIVQVKF